MWDLEFFKKDNQRCPTREFVQEQSPQDRVRINRSFKLLAEHGNALRGTDVHYLEDGLYELRVRVVKKQYRFIFFYHHQRIIVVTHGFLKKQSAVPRREIEQAQTYRNIYLERMRSK